MQCIHYTDSCKVMEIDISLHFILFAFKWICMNTVVVSTKAKAWQCEMKSVAVKHLSLYLFGAYFMNKRLKVLLSHSLIIILIYLNLTDNKEFDRITR